MGGGRSHPLIEVFPKIPREYPLLDPVEASAVVSGYLQLRGHTRDKVRLSLNRLNQAQRRHNLGDQAVELCIALEALVGDDQTTELTHKIKVRGARILGGDDKQRARHSSIIGRTYDIRSKLVHTGRVDEGKKYNIVGETSTPTQIIEEAVPLVASLIKTLIREGSIPNWTSFDIC